MLALALIGEAGIVLTRLAKRFGVADVLIAVKDQPFMASLLYYFGILTLTGVGILGKAILNIPNLVARSLYVERLREMWLPPYEDRQTIPRLAETVYVQGDLAPLVAFIEGRYFPILSNRDYRWSNDLVTVQTPLPNPPPQGGREQENQWLELSNPTQATGGSDRLHELMVKIAFLTLLFDDRLYMMVSETEM